MTKDSLMELGLTQEQADKVMESLDGAFVPKARFNEINTQLQSARAAVRDRDGQLEALKTSAGNTQEMRQKIAELQAANETQRKKHEEELRTLRVSHAVDAALRDAGAINAVTVKPLLVSFLEKAALTENGEIPGLADEISKLAKDESTSFLFRGKETGVPVVSGASPAGSVTAAPQTLSTGYEIRLEQARKAGNSALAVAIKREAAADGIQLY